MKLRLLSLKTLALTLAGVFIFSILFGWFALPRIVQSQAESFIAEKSGHRLSMSRPEFNPFELSLRLSDLRLSEPDGKPLLAFRELVLDLSASSIYRRALVLDGIRINGLEATAVLLPDGKLNWSALLSSLQGKEQSSDSAMPRFDIHRVELSGSRIDFTDNRVKPAFVTRIEPMDLVLSDFSSLPGENGQYKFSARTSFGAQLTWQGNARLNPVEAGGSFSLEGVNLAAASGYLGSLPIAPPKGVAGLSANYRVAYAGGKLDAVLDKISAKLTGLELAQPAGPAVRIGTVELKEGSFDLAKNSLALGAVTLSGSTVDLPKASKAMELGSLAVENIRVNLNSRQASVGQIALNDGHVRISRDAGGRIDVLEALKSSSAKPKTAKQETEAAKLKTGNSKTENLGAAWRYRLEKLELAGFDVLFRDDAVKAELALKDIAIGIEGVSEDMSVSLPVKAAFNVRDGGRFEAEGSIVPAVPSADIRLKLTDLALKPAQPYLTPVAMLKLAGGKLSTAGNVSYSPKGAGYKGEFSLRDLLVNEADTGNLFLAWKSLGSRAFEVSPSKLDMDELTINGLDTALIINKDKTLSFKRILKQPASPAPAAAPAPAPALALAAAQPSFLVNIDRLRFTRGEMDFADYSLALPFGTRIHDLKGVVTGLSNRPDALGHLELDGQVDEYGVARAVGQLELANPTDLMDIRVVFRNIAMSRLTPYSATFAGRKIDSGKLSLDLEYKIKQRQLEGKNQVVMDQLVLGEKVESPDAKDLPLDLAIGILQDSDGRIDLGLPISGSLDDPKFSYGGIIWQAITNILGKIATAPFRALGALFGGDDKFESIVFEAGNAQLTPPEREKLVRLAEVLNKRPALTISVHGVYADTDRVALQDLQMRRTVAQESGQRLEADEDPGPLSTRQPKVQKALESLFSDSLGGGELASLKDGFRRANPGKMEESTTGKVLSGLTGLFREKRVLSEQEVAKLKGADFYMVLFERLRGTVSIDDKQLKSLAAARGDATVAALKEAGASAERVSVLEAEKVTTEGRDVPVKLVLGTAKAN